MVNPTVAPVFKCERNRDRLFKIRQLSSSAKEERGGVVNTQALHLLNISSWLSRRLSPNPGLPVNRLTFPEQQGFTNEDILWAFGIWSVILCLSPVIVFYMLMVA